MVRMGVFDSPYKYEPINKMAAKGVHSDHLKECESVPPHVTTINVDRLPDNVREQRIWEFKQQLINLRERTGDCSPRNIKKICTKAAFNSNGDEVEHYVCACFVRVQSTPYPLRLLKQFSTYAVCAPFLDVFSDRHKAKCAARILAEILRCRVSSSVATEVSVEDAVQYFPLYRELLNDL